MTKLEEERLEILKQKGRIYRDECTKAMNRTFSSLAKKGIINQIFDKNTGLTYWKYSNENNNINEIKLFHENKYKKA